jgi:hypothetical protein
MLFAPWVRNKLAKPFTARKASDFELSPVRDGTRPAVPTALCNSGGDYPALKRWANL